MKKQTKAAALNTRIDEEVKATEAQAQEVQTEELDLLSRRPAPCIEYGKPQIIFINRVVRVVRPVVVKGTNEHEPDKIEHREYYELYFKLLDTEYATKSRELKTTVFPYLLDIINRVVLEKRSKAICATFRAEPFEYPERDDNGEQTGRMIQAVANKIDTVAPLSEAELVEVRNLFF